MRLYLSKPGLICAAGKNPSEFFESLVIGSQKGIKKTECAGTDFFAARIPDEWLSPVDEAFDMRVIRILDRALEQISPAVNKAVSLFGKERVGVCVGSCDNGSECSFEAHKEFFENGAFPCNYNPIVQGADYPAVFASKKWGVLGPSLSFATACSSSASAFVKARELIESDICDAVVVGGVDIVSNTVLLGFNSLEAISVESPTNPLSENRKGITLGDGAAFFVLAKADLDETGIVLLGCGESADASHMTAPLPDGSGALAAMQAALHDANLAPTCIDYVNLHATGTKLNDAMESRAVKKNFNDYNVPVSGIKPVTGHTLGASGALELAACFLAVQNQKAPVHVWDGVQDMELPCLNVVSQNSKFPKGIRTCMSNSFAFGGCNVSLIIGKEDENN